MEHQQPSHHHSGHKHHALVQTLLECATACEECAAACLDEEDVKHMARCIELDRDCADVCFTGAKLLLRDSNIAHKFLAICQEACRMCAEECSLHSHEHCQRCAEACRRCEQACQQHIQASHSANKNAL